MARLFIYLWSAKFRKKGVYKYVLILQRGSVVIKFIAQLSCSGPVSDELVNRC